MSRKSQILLVDDEKPCLDSLKMILEMEDYDVLDAENAVDARTLLQETDACSPALAIVDYALSGEENGDSLAKFLLESMPTIEVIIASGYHFPANLSHERLHFLAKPFNSERLLKLVKYYAA